MTESLNRGRRREPPEGSEVSEQRSGGDRHDPRQRDAVHSSAYSSKPNGSSKQDAPSKQDGFSPSDLSAEEAALLRGSRPITLKAAGGGSKGSPPNGPRLSEFSESLPESPNEGALGLVRVEAPTYAEALREIRQRFGDDVSIVHTRVIRRKGMLGVLGATGVEVYVTGRGEYEEWRRHPGSNAHQVPRESTSRVSRDGVNPATPALGNGRSDALDPRNPPWAQPNAVVRSKTDNPWGIAGDHAPDSHGFDARRVTDRSRRTGATQTNAKAAPTGETDPDNVVRALERLSKKIGHVMAESGQRVEPQRPGQRGPLDPTRGGDAFSSRIPGNYGPGTPRPRASGVEPRGSAGSPRGDHPKSPAPREEERPSAPLEPKTRGPGLTHPVVVAAKRVLEEWGVSAPICAELLGKLSRRSLTTLSGDRVECRELARLQLRELIRPKLPPSRPIPRPLPGKRRIVSLVGPTVVGKTTTLAKLGALFRITEQSRVGFITLDTYRIGAVDQLRRYADIIQVPLEVVSPGSNLPEAIERLGDVEVILIDTAGRSQKDADRIHELRSMLQGIGELEVHLCLALSASPEAILAAAENFKVVGYSRILITKLDEAYRHGVLLDLFQRAKTPVSYVTVGQEVPDDIHTATPERLEDLILGES